MAVVDRDPFLRHIRHLVGTRLAGASDAELLGRFVSRRDEDAVAELVRRYGALVFGACRRVVGDAHTAEDVFQATFLVLVRKAASLERRPLGNWLYTVAYRLALTARARDARRRYVETRAALSPAAETLPERMNELCVLVEEELQRLPERYRAPLVLCYLEGKTNEQAAQALGWPRGSMSRRIAQAREALRERLRRRGYPGPGQVGSLLAGLARTAPPVPLALKESTVRSALSFVSQPAVGGAACAEAVSLAKKALHTMALQRIKLVCVLILGAGLIGGNAVLLVRTVVGQPAAADHAPGTSSPSRAAAPVRAEARLGSTSLRHGDVVQFLGFVPEGGGLVSAANDQTIRLWDLKTGKEVRRFDRPTSKGTTVLIKAGGGKMLMKGPAPYTSGGTPEAGAGFRVALSRDGKLLAANRGAAVYVWEMASGKLLHTFHDPESVADLQFGDDGGTVATVSMKGKVTAWDLRASGRNGDRHTVLPSQSPFLLNKGVHGFNAAAQSAEEHTVGRLALAPGGRYLAWEDVEAAAQQSVLKVQDLAAGKQVGTARLPLDGAKALTFAPDGKTLAWTSFDGRVRVWACTGTAEPRILNPEGQPAAEDVQALAFAPDGKTLAACRADRTVQLWDVDAGKVLREVGTPMETPRHPGRVLIQWGSGATPIELAFAPDGKSFACSLGGVLVRRFDTASGAEIAPPSGGHAGPVVNVHLSADGKTALASAAAHDVGHAWDVATNRELRQIPVRVARRESSKGVLETSRQARPSHPSSGRATPIDAYRLALSAGGRYFAAVSKGAVTVWDTADGHKAGDFRADASVLSALAVAPDGKTVATAGQAREVHLWDVETGRERHVLSAKPADEPNANARMLVYEAVGGVLGQELVFSPDGRYLAGAGPRRQLCLWNAISGDKIWEKELPADQVIERFAFTTGGLGLAAVNRDSTVSLYETATGNLRGRLGRPDPSRPKPAAVKIGDNAPMLLVHTEDAPSPVSIAATPSGRFLAVANGNPVIHVWDVATAREVARFPSGQGGVVGLAFGAGGTRLISGGTDTTAVVWNVEPYTKIADSAESPPPASELDRLWNDLADQNGEKAFAAQRTLCRHPGQAAALVRVRLPAARAADPERLVSLIGDLSGNSLSARNKAAAELREIGEVAQPALERAMAGGVSLAVRQRIERLLGELAAGPGGRRSQERRALETLALAGGPEAREVLAALADGATPASLTREARSALRTLDH